MTNLKEVKQNSQFMTWLFNEEQPQASNEPKDKRQPKNKWLLAISKRQRYEAFKHNNY